LSSRTGARISASPRSEMACIQERVITLSGPRDAVHSAAEEVCEMVQDDPHLKEYMNVSGPFPDNMAAQPMASMTNGQRTRAPQGSLPGAQQSFSNGFQNGQQTMGRNGYVSQNSFQSHNSFNNQAPGYYTDTIGHGNNSMQNNMMISRQQFSPEVLNHTISVECQFPDQAVGVIIGKGGAVLKEISIRSSAKVHISPKDQMEEGSNMRNVSISGTFQNVNFAHALMIQRMLEFPQHPVGDFQARQGS